MRSARTSLSVNVAIVLVGILLAPFASASTFVAIDSATLIERSDRVIEGRVVALESFWNENGRVIVTEAVIRISETILGAPTSELRVRVPGGTVGDFRVEASGFPKFAEGQHVLLFLEADASTGANTVVGHQQGHFEVVERLDGVSVAVPQIDEGASLFRPDGTLMRASQSTELGEFKSRVRNLARQTGRIVN